MPKMPDVLLKCSICGRDEFNYDLVYSMPCCGEAVCIDYCLKDTNKCPKCFTLIDEDMLDELKT